MKLPFGLSGSESAKIADTLARPGNGPRKASPDKF
jgi:hypothetical protein